MKAIRTKKCRKCGQNKPITEFPNKFRWCFDCAGISKERKAELRIREAIEYYNDNRKPGEAELTAASLALKVFHDKKSKDICKIKLFSGIMNNKRRFVDLNWLITISEVTGFPANELIQYS